MRVWLLLFTIVIVHLDYLQIRVELRSSDEWPPLGRAVVWEDAGQA